MEFLISNFPIAQLTLFKFSNLLNMTIGTFNLTLEFQYKYSHSHLEKKMRVFSFQMTYFSMTSVKLDTLIKLKGPVTHPMIVVVIFFIDIEIFINSY